MTPAKKKGTIRWPTISPYPEYHNYGLGWRHILLLLSVVALACAAPLNARSRWLCCLASCSKVSSSLTRWSRSAWRAFCHRLLWAWASERKSRQACGVNMSTTSPKIFKTKHLTIEFPQFGCSRARIAWSSDWIPISLIQHSNTYINHSIRGDAEQRGPLCHLTNLVPSLSSQMQTV